MPIPVATRTLTVLRPQAPDGGGVDPVLASYGSGVAVQVQTVTVITGLRAHIGSPGGAERIVNGQQEYTTYRCTTDPFDFQPRDQVLDSLTGATYEVTSAVRRDEVPMLSHCQLTLSLNQGVAP